MHCEPADGSDRGAPVDDLEVHRPRRLSVDLDHDSPNAVRLVLGARDERADALGVARPDRGEKRLHLLVREELDEEGHVGRRGHGGRDAHPATVAAWRRRSTRAPEASATPARISARPPSTAAVIGSSSSTAP